MSTASQSRRAVAGQDRKPLPQLDYWLLGAALTLLGVGLVMVAIRFKNSQ